ncbi:hypothetical protein [Nocardia carnea]|uniref:hypothetical protein n=1 Tax=Nocardia carnea TaxID=37328 RepID=UPI002454ADC8|nr:hypothetical protein [Nocardia carnea]
MPEHQKVAAGRIMPGRAAITGRKELNADSPVMVMPMEANDPICGGPQSHHTATVDLGCEVEWRDLIDVPGAMPPRLLHRT